MTARTAREEILGDIKRALHGEGKTGSPRIASALAGSNQLEKLVAGIRESCESRRADLVQQFEFELTRIGGRFHRAPDSESALGYIQQVAAEWRTKRIVAWEDRLVGVIGLREKLGEMGIEFLTETIGPEFIESSATAEIGVSGVDYAIADTGTLVLLARKGQARSISLLPPVHIAVVKPEQVLSGLSDLFPLLRSTAVAEGRDLSSAITLITGPSRTADIELTLVVGVHGPQQLHVVLLDQ